MTAPELIAAHMKTLGFTENHGEGWYKAGTQGILYFTPEEASYLTLQDRKARRDELVRTDLYCVHDRIAQLDKEIEVLEDLKGLMPEQFHGTLQNYFNSGANKGTGEEG